MLHASDLLYGYFLTTAERIKIGRGFFCTLSVLRENYDDEARTFDFHKK